MAAAPRGSASATAAPTKAVASGSIQTCCTALAAEAAAKTPNQHRYSSASAICNGLEKELKAGKANLDAVKVTLRAQLHGVPVPNGC